ncbi:MAG: PIN domain-containing protein [Phycisphaerales bacterium]|nr:PIN domain-containing protein [Phycisphaerales bacterium]
MIAIDTNIWVYALVDADDRRRLRAANLIAQTPAAKTVIPWQVVIEFASIVSKRVRSGQLDATAYEAIPRMAGHFPIVMPTTACLSLALSVQQTHQVSFWDSLLIAACVEAGVTTLYSEDAQSRPEIEGVRIVNPLSA